jgi:hypothetical protein
MEADVPRARAGARPHTRRIVLDERAARGIEAQNMHSINALVRHDDEPTARIEDRLVGMGVFLMPLPWSGLTVRQGELASGPKRTIRIAREKRDAGSRREQNVSVALIDGDSG